MAVSDFSGRSITPAFENIVGQLNQRAKLELERPGKYGKLNSLATPVKEEVQKRQDVEIKQNLERFRYALQDELAENEYNRGKKVLTDDEIKTLSKDLLGSEDAAVFLEPIRNIPLTEEDLSKALTRASDRKNTVDIQKRLQQEANTLRVQREEAFTANDLKKVTEFDNKISELEMRSNLFGIEDTRKLAAEGLPGMESDSRTLRYSFFNYKDPETGVSRQGKRDKITGEMLMDPTTDPEVGYSPKVDPTTGLLTGQKPPELFPEDIDADGRILNISKANPIERKIFTDKIAAGFDSDKVVSTAMQSLANADVALEQIKSKNPIADQSTRVFMARASGEVGNLSATEQDQYGGSPALVEKAKNMASLIMKGTISDDNRRLLVEILELWKRKRQDAIDKRVDFWVNRAESVTPTLSPQYIRKALVPRSQSATLSRPASPQVDIEDDIEEISDVGEE